MVVEQRGAHSARKHRRKQALSEQNRDFCRKARERRLPGTLRAAPAGDAGMYGNWRKGRVIGYGGDLADVHRLMQLEAAGGITEFTTGLPLRATMPEGTTLEELAAMWGADEAPPRGTAAEVAARFRLSLVQSGAQVEEAVDGAATAKSRDACATFSRVLAKNRVSKANFRQHS